MFDEPDEQRRLGPRTEAPVPRRPAVAETAPPPRARRRAAAGVRRATPFVAGIAAAFLAIAAFGIVNPGRPPITLRDVNIAVASALASQTPAAPRSELVYAVVRPSLVIIETDRANDGADDGHGLGSGVVVNDAGLVLTALHVVAGATTIKITYANGSSSSATIASSTARVATSPCSSRTSRPQASCRRRSATRPRCGSGARRTSSATRSASPAR